MGDDARRIRQTLEDAQGRARQLERAAGKHLERLHALQEQLRAEHARVKALEKERDQLLAAAKDAERAFSHLMQRLEDRTEVGRRQLQRIRELEHLLAERTRALARAERAR